MSASVESKPTTVMRSETVLGELREMAETAPALARRLAWDYLRDLGDRARRDQLAELFARGTAPEGPNGAMEGLIVGNLFGIPEAYLANPLMKIDPTLSLIHISEPTRRLRGSRMPSSA